MSIEIDHYTNRIFIDDAATNVPLVLQPKGTGAIQTELADSTAAGGNARGSNAVDLQSDRLSASQVASGANSGVLSGLSNTASGGWSVAAGGRGNLAGADYTAVAGGRANNASGLYNFIGGGELNTGSSGTAATTQAAATNGVTNGSTAVTLAATNSNIRVGQLIIGTGIPNIPPTYVAAISGTSLTLSQNATETGTPTLSFFNGNATICGGGSNSASGAFSTICGGGGWSTGTRNNATGDYSFIGGGNTNSTSGQFAISLGGANNGSSGTYSVNLGGAGNSSTGFGSVVLGGSNNSGNATYSLVGGQQATNRSISSIAFAGGSTSTSGDAQFRLFVVRGATTDATATVLTTNGAAAGTGNQVVLPNNSAFFFRGDIVAGVTGAGNTKGWTIEGVIKRGANAASTVLVGTPTVTSTYADAGASTWTIACTADTTNGGLRVTFTGQAGTTIRAVAQIRTTEMTY